MKYTPQSFFVVVVFWVFSLSLLLYFGALFFFWSKMFSAILSDFFFLQSSMRKAKSPHFTLHVKGQSLYHVYHLPRKGYHVCACLCHFCENCFHVPKSYWSSQRGNKTQICVFLLEVTWISSICVSHGTLLARRGLGSQPDLLHEESTLYQGPQKMHMHCIM